MKRIALNLLRTLVLGLALHLQPSSGLAQGVGFKLLTTFTNPAPVSYDSFGVSVAAVGTDRVLIGADGHMLIPSPSRAVYLFSTDGALLTTFTNPSPTADDYFGHSVAAVGTDRVLIGAYGNDTGATNAGVAYLFSTNGTLLATFTNPAPAIDDCFGWSVEAVGPDRVLIGASLADVGLHDVGVVYLFTTNGKLLATLANPTPDYSDRFGHSLATVGTDRILIGSPLASVGFYSAGAAFLFSTDGVLLTTFTNPTPASSDWFGYPVAAVGTDRVLIGAPYDSTAAEWSGAAYLFSTNGDLLTTFTNLVPAARDYFGSSVAALGTDRVLIGSPYGDASAEDSGVAYLFSTNGDLLTTFTNPTPASSDWFGDPVVAVGTDRMLIGAYGNDTGATDAGAVYLFSLAEQTPAPSLTILITPTNTVAVSWPSLSTGWTLQQNTNGVASVNWSNAPGPIQDDGTNNTLIVSPSAENRFYRLFKP